MGLKKTDNLLLASSRENPTGQKPLCEPKKKWEADSALFSASSSGPAFEDAGALNSMAFALWRLPSHLALGFIFFYQKCLSPLLPPCCRFRPTCSCYAAEAVKNHGFWWGSYLASRRLLKCHPFHPGGYDPVPPKDSFPEHKHRLPAAEEPTHEK